MKRKNDWWIEPLIKYGFLAIGLGGGLLGCYVIVHFIRKFW